MARISAHYGLNGSLPFEDVELTQDNLRFLDPHRIRMRRGTDPHARDAVALIDSFFDDAVASITGGSDDDRARTQRIFEKFAEPWQTRLGMSRYGFHGHGGARTTGHAIYAELSTNARALLEVGHLKRLEHLGLFVEDVGNDITSDITTRITFSALADFTEEMMMRFPPLGSKGVTTSQHQVWDPAARTWTDRSFTLPAPEGKALILVPRAWTGSSLLMTPTRFYETTMLSYAQQEQTVRLPNGRLAYPPKWSLKKQHDLRRGRQTHIQVAMRAHEAGDNVVKRFETFVDEKAAA